MTDSLPAPNALLRGVPGRGAHAEVHKLPGKGSKPAPTRDDHGRRSSSTVKIFTVHHAVPDRYAHNDVFAPFITGLVVGQAHPVFITDEDKDNIADRVGYAEMRAHYYVWKNAISELDYVGFHHYRRAFIFDFMMESNTTSPAARLWAAKAKDRTIPPPAVDRETFHGYVDWLQSWDNTKLKRFKRWVERFDVITPWVQVLPVTIGDQYCQCHRFEDWAAFLSVIRRHPRFAKLKEHWDPQISYVIPCNMFILRRQIFDEYMEFWNEVMLDLASSIFSDDDPYQFRTVGFLSERLFTIYLHHLRLERPSLRVAELPYLVYEPGIPRLSAIDSMEASLGVGLKLLDGQNGAEDAAAAITSAGRDQAAGIGRLLGVVSKVVAENDKRLGQVERGAVERKAEIDGLKSDSAGFKAEIDGLKSDSAGFKTEIDGLKSDSAGFKTEIDGLKSDSAGLKTETDGFKSDSAGRFAQVEQSLNEYRVVLEQTAAAGSGAIEALRRSMAEELAARDEYAQKEIARIRDALVRTEQEREERQAEWITVQTELAELRARLTAAEGRLQQNFAEIREQSTKAETLGMALAQAERQSKEQRGNLEHLQAQNSQLQDELTAARQVSKRLMTALQTSYPAQPADGALKPRNGALQRLASLVGL